MIDDNMSVFFLVLLKLSDLEAFHVNFNTFSENIILPLRFQSKFLSILS